MQCLGFWVPGIDLLLYLAVGWLPFIGRVSSRIDVRWDLVASAVLCAAALAGGAHLFMRWLYREMRAADADAGADGTAPAPGGWRLRWTISAMALVLLMFVAGTAAVGIVHQATWLARSPRPVYTRSAHAANRIKCASNLRQIGFALSMYANDHGGKFPDDLPTLLLHADIT